MRPLVHIGYHKTASTWLQRQVFKPEMGFEPMLDQAQLDEMLVTPHDLDFDPNTAKRTLLEPVSDVPSGRIPVLSSENLTGHPFFGGRDSAALARRLHSVLPEATILIIVRSQATILPSVYMQYLKRGGVQPPKQFFAGAAGVNYPGFDPHHFQYDRLIALYQSLFERVIVLTYEALKRDPQAFAARLLADAGCPPVPLSNTQLQRVSPSPSTGAIPLLRAANRLRRSTLNPSPALVMGHEGGLFDKALFATARRMPRTEALSNYVERKLAPLYTQSNAKLSCLTNGSLDLSAYP